MTTRSKEREEFLGDILIGFVEDYGTNSWRQIKGGTYKWSDEQPMTNSVTFIELGDGDMYEEHAVTSETVATGLNRLLSGEVGMNSQMLANIKEANRENDAGQIDAYDADMIVQAAVFGELVYG